MANEKIAVIGLGYVGYPLAILLAEHFENVVGFDVSKTRVNELRNCIDSTGEINVERIQRSSLQVTADLADIEGHTFYIITVPTPVRDDKQPDLTPLESASKTVGAILKKGDAVVYESTVYPGITEDYCGAIVAEVSGLTPGKDFSIGYSPERINPGDKKNTVENIIKIVSGDTPESLERIAGIYEKIICAGIHRAESIKVAECAKVLENTQRDINIALMNELSIICNKINVPTMSVIEAASTKWNFQKYTPGLVGGHCIGVDPYYLANLSEKLGHHPQVILSGRRTNDGMVDYVSLELLKRLAMKNKSLADCNVGLLGLTFKENTPDLRNSKSIELCHKLQELGVMVKVHDSIVKPADLQKYDMEMCDFESLVDLDMLILAVPHQEYTDLDFNSMLTDQGHLIDLKSIVRDYPLSSKNYWAL